jgi:hypothetical protein
MTGPMVIAANVYLETVSRAHSVYSLQKIALLGISHIKKVLKSGTCSLSSGIYHWFKRKSTRRRKTCAKRNNSVGFYTICAACCMLKTITGATQQKYNIYIYKTK